MRFAGDGHPTAGAARPMARRRPVVVAHRAGNLDADVAVPSGWPGSRADVVEADVHWFRGRIEVRHSKALWPSALLYEGRRLVPRPAPRPAFARVIEALPAGPELWIDLKGPDPRLAVGVKALVSAHQPLWVSARCWWQLAPFRTRAGTLTFMSVGSRWQRPLARRALLLGWSSGIVIHERLASEQFMTSVPREAPVVTWAVEDKERACLLLARGVAGLIIDSPALMTEMRAHIDTDGRYADPS